MKSKSLPIDPDGKWKNDLQELTEQVQYGMISEPTIIYRVGEFVKFGHTKSCEIIESLHDNRVYKVRITYESTRNNPEEVTIMCVAWFDVFPTFVQPHLVSQAANDRTTFTNSCVESLIHYLYHHAGIDTDVAYQRGIVWDLSQKQLLIHSIFHNVPIGLFILNKRNYNFAGKLYEVIDGKQRLMTLVDFFEGRFAYDGLLYRDMNWKDQHRFESYPISIGTVEEMTEREKMAIFLRYNTTGKPVAQEHLDKVREMMDKCNLAGGYEVKPMRKME